MSQDKKRMKKIVLGMIGLFWSGSCFLSAAENGKAIDWKTEIPQPVYDADTELVEFYWQTWEIAHRNVKTRDGLVQSPYLDEGFSDESSWIWDTCFMALFSKYAPNAFPGVETLNNFYLPIHEKIPSPVSIHIVDNPPLFAWAEYQNALFRGDKKHLENLLLKTRYLQRHYEWFDSLDSPMHYKHLGPNSIPTCLRKHELGFFWEGGRSGMDNTPRGRVGTQALEARPNNPEMLWIDAISQQALSSLYISRMAGLIGQKELAAEWFKRWRVSESIVNAYYWDSEDGMYYDINSVSLAPMKVLTPAPFWAMLARIPSPIQAARMVEYVRSPDKLGGSVPWPSLSRDDSDFDTKTGNYWRGSVWLPTAYMGIKAVESYGYLDLAHENALAIVKHMAQTYKETEPHTIWECYAPDSARPATEFGKQVRPDFCGWSALGPISLFLENIIGIYEVNAFEGVVKWHLPVRDKAIGIKNFRFGKTITDIIYRKGKVRVKSNTPYRLIINGVTFSIKAGDNLITL